MIRSWEPKRGLQLVMVRKLSVGVTPGCEGTGSRTSASDGITIWLFRNT